MLKILVVDDSGVIRRLLSDYLTELGHHVDLAIDGQEGIDRALETDYQLIICDIHMPQKNGYQVFCEVSQKKSETVFVMTDSLPDELADMAQRAGACCCLKKPFDLIEVRETVEKLASAIETS
jgi:CheY-like chemotaxis protein